MISVTPNIIDSPNRVDLSDNPSTSPNNPMSSGNVSSTLKLSPSPTPHRVVESSAQRPPSTPHSPHESKTSFPSSLAPLPLLMLPSLSTYGLISGQTHTSTRHQQLVPWPFLGYPGPLPLIFSWPQPLCSSEQTFHWLQKFVSPWQPFPFHDEYELLQP
ncbi:hypothetical protein V6N13_028565 [Hibiscus sabdariffa]|uniref:Uncharacterized protein n=2 Tax=Hibiscus sabdariffa TaxID=183260 RepID=A0ABR1ZVQ4_9ROSI